MNRLYYIAQAQVWPDGSNCVTLFMMYKINIQMTSKSVDQLSRYSGTAPGGDWQGLSREPYAYEGQNS